MAFKVNELTQDEFGRISGILAVNKPVGMTSHDVVNIARRELNMRKIGHAGALDPFASGVLVLLVGKATKLSEKFIDADKEYIAKIVLGIKTDSADPEGEILEVTQPSDNLSENDISNALINFTPSYQQYVPIYSSVKVNGQKLRVLARQAEAHRVYNGKDGKRYAEFDFDETIKKIEVPQKLRQIPEIELLNFVKEHNLDDYKIGLTESEPSYTEPETPSSLPVADIRVACGKGTYIRALAEDIGAALELPSMLVELVRSRVDRIKLENCIESDEIKSTLK